MTTSFAAFPPLFSAPVRVVGRDWPVTAFTGFTAFFHDTWAVFFLGNMENEVCFLLE